MLSLLGVLYHENDIPDLIMNKSYTMIPFSSKIKASRTDLICSLLHSYCDKIMPLDEMTSKI